MKVSDIENRLYKAIPKDYTWVGARGEPYGLQGQNFLTKHIFPSNTRTKEVNKVLFCVTPTYGVQKYFIENGYDLLISHHPSGVYDPRIPHMIFHTALDCCEGGLNDQWRDALNITDSAHFDDNLGWYGAIEPISFGDLVTKVGSFTGGGVIGQTWIDPNASDDIIRSVCVCSGLGGLVHAEASRSEADCYIVGEAMHDYSCGNNGGFKALIETGHTLSEWIGVNLFKKLLPEVTVDCAPIGIDRYSGEIFRK